MDKHISLSPCPFCGNHVEMVNTKTYPNFERSPAYMKCKTCNYHIAAFDDENLINRWNDRPIEDALTARIAELEAALVSSGNQVGLYLEELFDLRKRIAELEAERRWIPVSERLPEKDGYYLVSDDHDGVLSCEFMTERRVEPIWDVAGVLYWMPLPEPPEVEK